MPPGRNAPYVHLTKNHTTKNQQWNKYSSRFDYEISTESSPDQPRRLSFTRPSPYQARIREFWETPSSFPEVQCPRKFQ